MRYCLSNGWVTFLPCCLQGARGAVLVFQGEQYLGFPLVCGSCRCYSLWRSGPYMHILGLTPPSLPCACSSLFSSATGWIRAQEGNSRGMEKDDCGADKGWAVPWSAIPQKGCKKKKKSKARVQAPIFDHPISHWKHLNLKAFFFPPTEDAQWINDSKILQVPATF